MAKNNFSDMLINPKLSFESKEPAREDVDLRRPPRMTVTVLTIVSIAALALNGVLTHYLLQLRGRAQAFEGQLAAVSQSLKLIDKRLDGSGNQIALLQSQLEVTMHRVGVTQKELKNAQALAERLKEEQKRNVEALNRELAQKANAERVASLLKEEAGEKFKGVNQETSTVKRR